MTIDLFGVDFLKGIIPDLIFGNLGPLQKAIFSS